MAVAVADFANETGEKDLDGLSGMLATSLEQSRVLDVVTRARLLEISRQRGGEADRLDEQVARAAGKAAGVQVLLLGTLRRGGAGYTLSIQGLDPAAGRGLFAVADGATRRTEIPGLVDRVSSRIRRELRERTEDVRASEVQIARAVTGSVEAYQYYSQGEQCYQRLARVGAGRLEECADSYRKALAIDPTFALAHYALALGSSEAPPTPEQRARMAEALKYIDRVPEKERLLIRAWAAHLDGRDTDALALYRVAVDRFPRETGALYMAGDLLHHQSKRALAAPFFERVLALDRTHAWALDHLVDDLAHLGERERLRRMADGLQQEPRVPGVLHALSEARGWLGDAPGALSAARSAVEVGGGAVAREDVVEALLFAGDLEGAEAELRAQLAEASGDPALRVGLAIVLASQGRRREGFAQLHGLSVPVDDERIWRLAYRVGDGRDEAAQEAASIPDDANYRPTMAVLLALAGDLGGASRFARGAPAQSTEAVLYEGLTLWRQGRHADALALLGQAERLDRAPATIAPAYLIAEIAADAGRDGEAAEAIERFHAIYEPLTIWRSWAYPRSLVLLARCQHRLHHVAEARATLARFFRMWRRTDPDAPLLAEAKTLEGRMGR
jgi:eukaryotic-like serine/threonine-protein kinase